MLDVISVTVAIYWAKRSDGCGQSGIAVQVRHATAIHSSTAWGTGESTIREMRGNGVNMEDLHAVS